MSAEPPVAFSLLHPFTAAVGEVRRAPRAAVLPALVLLLPAVPLLAGLDLLLREGGSAALQGWIAGSPVGTANVLITEPSATGRRTRAGLAALLAALVATVAAAGLVSGAAARPRTPRAVRRTLAEWPALLVALTAQALLLAALIAGLVAVSVLAGRVRFQLGTVVLVAGLLPLGLAALRTSLWPAIAIGRGLTVRAAVRASWALTAGSVTRLAGAAVVAGLLVLGPALVLRWVLGEALTVLADRELLALSPVAVDLWALAPVPLAALVLVLLWGREAPGLVEALERFAAAPALGPGAGQPPSGG